MVSASNSGRPEGARGRPPKERPASAFSASTPRIKKCGPQRPHKKCRGDPVRPGGPGTMLLAMGPENFYEEVPREMAILRSRERFSGRSEGRLESFFGEVFGGTAILRFSGHPL